MNKANTAHKGLTAVNDIVSTEIISQFTICLLAVNKHHVCGIPALQGMAGILPASAPPELGLQGSRCKRKIGFPPRFSPSFFAFKIIHFRVCFPLLFALFFLQVFWSIPGSAIPGSKPLVSQESCIPTSLRFFSPFLSLLSRSRP